MTKTSNLTQYIIEPIKKNLGKKLKTYCYHDVCNEGELTTNNKGIDIISHQLELKFEGEVPIYISWANIEGWSQYCLCVSEDSFSIGAETFIKKDDNWLKIVGKRLSSFEVYGYKENVVSSFDLATERTTKEIHHFEPHLLILHFDNNTLLGVANFYLEDDFVPKYPIGDDVWIIFDKNQIDSFIEKLSLENLTLEELPTTERL